MSNLNAVRGELRLVEERDEPARPHRLHLIAIGAVLLIAMIAGAAEIHMLPTFSADDLGSILFGAG
ncbi:MAG: hypothetical protein M3N26_04245 [Pseudomonadota bacterium]|nr:hypothetical protein [Pseudomonadota bacterium]